MLILQDVVQVNLKVEISRYKQCKQVISYADTNFSYFQRDYFIGTSIAKNQSYSFSDEQFTDYIYINRLY